MPTLDQDTTIFVLCVGLDAIESEVNREIAMYREAPCIQQKEHAGFKFYKRHSLFHDTIHYALHRQRRSLCHASCVSRQFRDSGTAAKLMYIRSNALIMDKLSVLSRFYKNMIKDYFRIGAQRILAVGTHQAI
jgi:hypothetical protein